MVKCTECKTSGLRGGFSVASSNSSDLKEYLKNHLMKEHQELNNASYHHFLPLQGL